MRKLTVWQGASLAGAAAALMLTAACGSDHAGGPAKAGAVKPAAQGAGKDSGYGYGSGSAYGSGSGSAYGSGSGKSQQSADLKPAGQLGLRQDAKIGPLVTDSQGFTLYRFDNDTAQPSKSNCNGPCASTWPPVAAGDAPSAVPGIDPAKLGWVVRADGSKQLTLGGWPLYRYSKDTAPGQANGQGVGGTWFAAGADGKKAAKLPPLSVMNNQQLGKVLVDGQGRTLYRFTKDNPWPMKFACVGGCLTTWKPAKPVTDAQAKAAGIDPKLVSTVTRPDGTKQLAVNCWPVYWFTGDKAPGDTNGQGVKGTWFANSPDGKKITKPAG
jgi:predicted lipoprotein with Yx(FWY)xxD motif